MTNKEYLDHIEKLILEIRSINFRNNWAYEQILHSFLKIKKMPIILYPYRENNLIYRSRINNKNYFQEINEISAPKEEYVKKYARANKPRQTLFYGSENRPTSYLGWRLKKDLTLALVYNPLDTRETDYNKIYGEGFDEFVEKTANEYKDGTIRFFKFIAEEYSMPVKDNIETYLITCAYSNLVFGYEHCDGIIYPSVPSAGGGFNVVLKENIILDNSIELEFVGKDTFLATKQDNGKHNFININSENAKKIDLVNDIIEWK
jgi:hypothetical protein